MLSRTKKRFILGLATFVAVVLFIVPGINVSRYKLSVARALSNALGRTVTVQDVSIQTFPQPGLLLKGVVVADDPTVSAEPMLRADEVLATIRASSLWRGHLEIGSLKLQYPSVNLVRTIDGRWNLESLLERARQIPSAPTAKASPETRPRFPYIEANAGRINLKIGQEKKVFALNEADFSLWLASEDEWRMRLKARPIRTDGNLTDTGTIKMEGAWKRAATLHETPFQLRFWWEDGQLGQLTTLVYGRDRGWRGSLRASAILNGRPDDLAVTTDVRVDDFRRYDIAINESLTLRAHCDARYQLSEHEVSKFDCQAPLGNGQMLAAGNFGIAPKRDFNLSVVAENVPVQFLSSLLRHAKKDIPEDLAASGVMNASVSVQTTPEGERVWTGKGESSPLQIRSSVLDKPLLVDAMHWYLIGPGTENPEVPVAKVPKKHPAKNELPQPDNLAFGFEPVSLALGGTTPATLRGWFGAKEFFADLQGEAALERLIGVGKLLGVPTVSSDLTGNAAGNLRIAGSWAGFALPQLTGNAQLRNVTAKINGVASPMKIPSALLIADEDRASLTKATGTFADVHSTLEFSMSWPRSCTSQSTSDEPACEMTVELKADQLNLDEINSLLNPRAQKRPWYAAIANTVMGTNRKSLPPIYATGHFSAGRVIAKNLVAGHVFGNMNITPQGFRLDTVNADILGGKFVGDIAGDFRGTTPAYSSEGNLVTIAVANLAALTRGSWGGGRLTASYKGSASGWTSDEIAASVKGTANFSWHDGVLHHIALDANGRPLQFKAFSGKLELANGVLTVSESKLQAPRSIYQVSGTASLGRNLELKLAGDGNTSFSISGTLEQPKVSAVKTPETQAVLR